MFELLGAEAEAPLEGSPHDHPERDQLARFMRCELDAVERRIVVRHLLTRCPQCLRVTRQAWRLGAKNPLDLKTVLEEPRPPEPVLRRPRTPVLESHLTGRKAAMHAIVSTARELLLEKVRVLEEVCEQLRAMCVILPSARKEAPEADDVVRELRVVIESVVEETLKSAIGDLRSAAYYPEPPPGESGTEEDEE